ncbi:hypothetical protein B0H16DRAFT_313474 [Mycena metata]|uniref:ferric-chelate reductase (NADPH) n=1 Tax=Mycena metata TaxID=1033252 RepID=A0AAD7JQW0_9AGAR|nr:hypothetical protein B0H16DRAFT_313474 [Mycena metata]
MSANGTTPASTGAKGAAPPTGRGGSTLDVGMLVYSTVVVLVCLLALVVVLRIPRAFARLWRVSEWTRGHILGYKRDILAPSLTRFSYTRAAAPIAIGYSEEAGSSQDSHTSERKPAPSAPAPKAAGSYPPHMVSMPLFLRPVASLLRSRVAPGFSVAQFAVCTGYLAVLLYPAIYRSAGPFTDINRYGCIAISQVPFIFVLASKNNILGMLLGMGYEKLNFLHQFVARLAIISAHLHGLGYIYKWCISDVFMQEIMQPKNAIGLSMLISFDCILLTSLAYVRKNAYNVFFYSHVVLSLALIILALYHRPQTLPYLRWTFAIYALDKFMRLVKTRISTATIRPIPELGLTRVEIPWINRGWRAGQHVRVQVLSSAMGVTGWAEVHPFTIASESESKEGLVLMCKKTGTWTHKLFAAAAATNRAEAGEGRQIKVVLEGPYGGPGFAMFNSYSAALFIVGGSGITFALSAIQELLQQRRRGESRARIIELVWVIQHPGSLVPLIPTFAAMFEQSVKAHLAISVHYTKTVVGAMHIKGVHPRLTLSAGRPRLIDAVESTVSLVAATEGRSGLVVGVCGPVGLGDDVSKTVGLVDPAKRDEIGGIELHEETFGW